VQARIDSGAVVQGTLLPSPPDRTDLEVPVLLLFDDDHSCLSARRATFPARIAVRVHAPSLDRDLAEGMSPDTTETLALRAQMLVRPSVRYGLARSLQSVLALAMEPFARPCVRVPLCRDRVRDASEDLQLLIDRLRTVAPVPAQGVARTIVLLSDGCGPLYHRGNDEDLCTRVRQAADALDPLTAW